MSLITMLDTKETVRKGIDSIKDFGKVFNGIQDHKAFCEKFPELVGDQAANFKKILSGIYELQGHLIYDYYNESTVKKTRWTEDQVRSLGLRRFEEYYYQHQFLHNVSATIDEIFEEKDALTKLGEWGTTPGDKAFRAYLLFVEESIDVIHFLGEFGYLFAEQAVMLEDNGKKFSFPDSLYKDSSFKEAVLAKMKSWIDEEENTDPLILYAKYSIDRPEVFTSDSLNIIDQVQFVRDLIRKYTFKDWKVYTEDFWTEEKLHDLFTMTIGSLANIFVQIQEFSNKNMDCFFGYVKLLYDLDDEKYGMFFAPDFIGLWVDFMPYFVYGCYVAKNWVNMQRHKEDPRYNPEHFGRIIGMEV